MRGPAAALELSLPIACTPGTDCFIYACGAETYDGHKGTDIRLRTTAEIAKRVGVLASAPGTVIGVRDGMADHLVRTDADREAVAALECGNGVRIDHGEGWITQYRHMRKGSIVVKKGDEVKPGAKLGEVGYSGQAAFAHVHIEVTTIRFSPKLRPLAARPRIRCGPNRRARCSHTSREHCSA
jgi:murein DD-endopeptidase MepM/ murein hydrolase activator NlpD